ncbi:MAG: hypothetical protein JNM27_21360 [Leptospirales bacterium]|nr:hypothetical protein [Leptospirales bacterium]
MKIPDSLIKAVDNLPLNSVSLGYSEIILFKSTELAQRQVGYRSHGLTGESLLGENDGDWLAEWFVIGYDSLCGDPFLVDTSDSKLPVLNAMHGEGSWNPDIVSTTFDGFSEALLVLEKLAKGREHPVGLESNPISEKERTRFLAQVARLAGTESNYWSLITRVPK